MVVIQKKARRLLRNDGDAAVMDSAAVRRRFIFIVLAFVVYFFHMHLSSTTTTVKPSTIQSSEIISGGNSDSSGAQVEYFEVDDLDFMESYSDDGALDDMLQYMDDVMALDDDSTILDDSVGTASASSTKDLTANKTSIRSASGAIKTTGASTAGRNVANSNKNDDPKKKQRQSLLPNHANEQPVTDGPVRVEAGDSIYKHKTCWDCSPVVIESQRLVFFTVPKVGCTVFKQLFRRMMNYTDWTTHQEGGPQIPHNPKVNGLKYLHHYSTDKATEMMTSPSWTRAIFLREPKERALSAYLDKVGKNNGKYVRFYCPQHCILNETLLCGRGAGRGRLSKGEMLVTFAEFVENVLEPCEDIHWNPQWERMEAKYWQYINFFGYFDSIEEDTNKLLHQLADPQAWEKYGATGWKRKGGAEGGSIDSSIFSSDTNALHATKAADKLARYYTTDLKDRVETHYRGDYESKFFQFTLNH